MVNKTPLLENKFILTREMNRKYAQYTYEKYHSRTRFITLLVSIIIFAAAFAVAAFLKWVILFLVLLLIGFYFFFLSWFGYLLTARVSYNDMTRFYGNPVNMHVTFYPEFFSVKGDDNSFEFPYAQVSDVINLPDMTILTISSKGSVTHGQVIDKKAFTEEELNKFYEILFTRIGKTAVHK